MEIPVAAIKVTMPLLARTCTRRLPMKPLAPVTTTGWSGVDVTSRTVEAFIRNNRSGPSKGADGTGKGATQVDRAGGDFSECHGLLDSAPANRDSKR